MSQIYFNYDDLSSDDANKARWAIFDSLLYALKEEPCNMNKACERASYLQGMAALFMAQFPEFYEKVLEEAPEHRKETHELRRIGFKMLSSIKDNSDKQND